MKNTGNNLKSYPEIVKNFRDGIFALHTRRFGTVAELIIEQTYGLTDAVNQHHDATDNEGNRIEIKFSRLLKQNKYPIDKHNIINAALESTAFNRALKYDEIKDHKFDSNIQQIKRSEFDILYYGLFFADKIAVFSAKSEEIFNIPGYSDFQHKGNEGEGQFHIHNDSIAYHMEYHFKEWITYDEIYEIFKNI